MVWVATLARTVYMAVVSSRIIKILVVLLKVLASNTAAAMYGSAADLLSSPMFRKNLNDAGKIAWQIIRFNFVMSFGGRPQDS